MLILVAVVAGLIVGSALTALTDRIIRGDSWVRGRSRCPACLKELRPRDLVPLVSFFALRGRCRACAQPIRWTYPAIEVATAALFVLAAVLAPTPGLLIRNCFIIAVLVAVFVIDARASIIPDEITLPALGVAVVWSILFRVPDLQDMLIGLVVGGGFFAVQYFISRGRWIGSGDIRLGAFLGAVLGWPYVALALLLAYWIGAIVALGFVASGKKKWGSEMPFGTFLSVAGIITLFAYEPITAWFHAY